MIDLCLGPHIPHTAKIKALKITKNSASYFLGDQKNDSLQRVYGISFPDNKQMKDYEKFMEEAAKRDHRRIGTVHLIDNLRSKICSFFTILVLDRVSSLHMEQEFTTL